MKYIVSAFAFLAVICCLTSAAPRPQVDQVLALLGGGGGGLPLGVLAQLLGGLGGQTGPTNVQRSGGSTSLTGLGNSATKLIGLDGNGNIPVLNNLIGG